jgi:hypothetical protein
MNEVKMNFTLKNERIIIINEVKKIMKEGENNHNYGKIQ